LVGSVGLVGLLPGPRLVFGWSNQPNQPLAGWTGWLDGLVRPTSVGRVGVAIIMTWHCMTYSQLTSSAK
jgi:hypothetical protein